MKKLHDARHPHKNMFFLRLYILNVSALLLRRVRCLLVPVSGYLGRFVAARAQQPPVPKKSLSFGEKKIIFTGYMLICTGVVFNEWVLTALISSDSIVEIQNRMAVWLFDIFCIALGLCCIKMGKRLPSQGIFLRLSQAYPRALACSIGLVVTVLLVVCAEGIFYGLNYYQQEQNQQKQVEKVSWISLSPPHKEGGVGEHPPQRVQGWNWTIADPSLGYTLPPNAQIAGEMTQGGTLIYRATSTTDAYHRRLTPIDSLEQRHTFLLFFGCSMTFGLGVNDNETLPYYVAQDASHYRPYNYGVMGYGPHHMLAQLQRGNLRKEIQEHQGIAIYTFIDHHINRAIGTMRVYNQWEKYSPFYTIDAHNNLVRKGSFTSGRPLVSFLYWILGNSQLFQYFNITFPVSIREEHIRLTARIIAEARIAFHQQFPNSEFYVLLYPGVGRGQDLIPYLVQADVKYIDYTHSIDWPNQELTLADGAHPTAQGHRTVAAHLAKSLGLLR